MGDRSIFANLSARILLSDDPNLHRGKFQHFVLSKPENTLDGGMDDRTSAGGRADNAEAGAWLCLLFSQSFFLAFPIKENRERQWRFLYYLVIFDKPQLTRRELNDILDKTVLGNEHKLVTKLLIDLYLKNCIGLADKNGTALPKKDGLEKQMKIDSKIIIDERFHSRIDIYVANFMGWLLERKEITSDEARGLMKKLYDFQFHDSFSAWSIFLRDLAAALPLNEAERAVFRGDLQDSSEYWVAMHTLAALFAESNGKEGHTLSDILHFISKRVTTFVKQPKLRTTILFLAKAGVLQTGKKGKEKTYTIHPHCKPTFEKYNRKLLSMRTELADLVGRP